MSVTRRRTLAVVSGLACGTAAAQPGALTGLPVGEAETLRPTRAQQVLGVRTDGTLVLGDAVEFADGVASDSPRGASAVDVYNSLGLAPSSGSGAARELVCGDICGPGGGPGFRWFFGDPVLAWVDDVQVDAAAAQSNPTFDGFLLLASIGDCDPAVTPEPFSVLFTMYDAPLVASDTNGDGVADSPYPRTDADGDGLVDEFSGGVLVSFSNSDTDGDGVGDVFDVAPGFYFFDALLLTDTDGDGVPGDPGAVDFGGFPTTDRDGDGNPDGVNEVFLTGGFGPDTDGDGVGDGPIFGAFVPSALNPLAAFYGTPDADPTGCLTGFGITEGSSSGALARQGEAACMPGSGMVSSTWDPANDFTDLTGAVSCPSPLTPAVLIQGASSGGTPPCADTNDDGLLTPADFNAWILAFNNQSSGCDQNGDGLCTPADFNAWIANFNSGAPCPTP